MDMGGGGEERTRTQGRSLTPLVRPSVCLCVRVRVRVCAYAYTM